MLVKNIEVSLTSVDKAAPPTNPSLLYVKLTGYAMV